MPFVECVVCALLGLGAGIGIAWVLIRRADRANFNSAETRAKELVSQAEKTAENLLKETELKAKDDIFRKRDEFNREVEQFKNEQRDQERRLEKKEDAAEQRHQAQQKKERMLQHNEKKLHEKKEMLDKHLAEAEAAVQEQTKKLHEISGLSRDNAEKLLLERLDKELADEVAGRIHRHEEMLKATTEEKARKVLAVSIQRYAAEHTADTTVSTVDIPSDDMKGRIIGREGRNIRTFEKATGVDVIVDDTPGVVIVSAFDNIRRETARLALTKLIQDGRIHPTRIEEVVKETQEEMERHILEVGKQAVLEANVGGMNEKLMQLLGRLKFRTSYSQNVLQHSLEVSSLCGLMADEIGLNGLLARRCGLLHDVGKAADHEMEGGHPKIGAELAKRYGETSKEVLHAIIGHHDDVTIDHVYTVLVAAADAISASRPGARRETLEKYVKRLEELEALASGFPGIEHAFAIQAGRELRVIANAHQLSDNEATKTCREIAKAIEQQLNYPGEIKVTVVRETRTVEFARQVGIAMRLLFLGDIVGAPGVDMVKNALPTLRRAERLDCVIANAENASGGSGMTPRVYRQLRQAGIDLVTMGDHIYKKQELIKTLESDDHICKPANFPKEAPGRSAVTLTLPDGTVVAAFSVLGRTFMRSVDCPFQAADQVLESLSAKVILVDVHAEATADKYLLAHHLKGRVTAILGTHTHVQTADEQILPGGTAFISDVGMTGPYDSILGRRIDRVLYTTRTFIPSAFDVAEGDPRLAGAIVECDAAGKAQSITRVMLDESGLKKMQETSSNVPT